MKDQIVIFDFSGIYQEEQFWKEEKIVWADVQEISGTNCYCDQDAVKKLKEKLEALPSEGIYFIDSGNYHYMSRIRAAKITEPFRLLVFDHHTDMQLPAFGGLLSCGGWIASALEEVENLREVYLIGPPQADYDQVEERFRCRVKYVPEEELPIKKWWEEVPTDLPLFVSIDKDVLCKQDASTTWSQGKMTLTQLLEGLEKLLERFQAENGQISQVDICGECDPKESTENYKNDQANRIFLNFWKKWLIDVKGRETL